MNLYPEMTASLWLRGLGPRLPGDPFDIAHAAATFTLERANGEIVMGPEAAALVDGSFRLIFTLPDEPGRYRILARATHGDAVLRLVKSFYVHPATDETP